MFVLFPEKRNENGRSFEKVGAPIPEKKKGRIENVKKKRKRKKESN